MIAKEASNVHHGARARSIIAKPNLQFDSASLSKSTKYTSSFYLLLSVGAAIRFKFSFKFEVQPPHTLITIGTEVTPC